MYLNIIVAVMDFVSRPLGMIKSSKQLTHFLQTMLFLANIFLVYVYFSDLILYQEALAYLMFVLIGLTFMTQGLATSYYMSESSRLSDNSNKEVVGSIMVNSLLSGVCVGNLLSNLMPTLKSKMYG